MEFRPFVPEAYAGTRSLTGLRYRGATLSITLHGFGDGPREVRLDGRPVPKAEVPARLEGDHTLEVWLNGVMPGGGVRLVENVASPATPVAGVEGGEAASPAARADRELVWSPVPGAIHYEIHRNGRRIAETRKTRHPASETDGVAEYQVLAVEERSLRSFLSEPVRVGPAEAARTAEPADRALETVHAGHQGAGYARSTADEQAPIEIRIDVHRAGRYAVDARYANGAGPISYGHGAAARTLLVDGRPAGTLLMPQRGARRWDDWGYTNAVTVWLEPGPHTLAVAWRPPNRNLSGEVDEALVDHLRWTRLAE